MKITACAICKNEEHLIGPWINHLLAIPQISEVIIVDTGSTDNTVSKIEELHDAGAPVYLHHMAWNDNFSEARNLCLHKAREHASEWCIMFDIDEFFNCNAKEFFDQLEKKVDSLLIIADIIQLFHVKFYTFDQIYFRRPPELTTYIDGTIYYSMDKATLRIFKKNTISSFSKDLHEHPIYEHGVTATYGSLLNTNLVKAKDLHKDFFVIHYDLAKLAYQAQQNNTSLEYEVGKKRLIYRRINPANTNGRNYTPEWAKTVDAETMLETVSQLGYDQLQQSLHIDGHIFPELPIDVNKLHNEELRRYLDD